MTLACKLLLESLFMLFGVAVYMGLLVGKRGPLGAAFFYPQPVQDRLAAIGKLAPEAEAARKKKIVAIELPVMLIVYFIFAVLINRPERFLSMFLQCWLLFLVQEGSFTLAVIGWWMMKTTWWDVPGTEDLQPLYHRNGKGVLKRFLLDIPKCAVLSLIASGLFTLIRLILPV